MVIGNDDTELAAMIETRANNITARGIVAQTWLEYGMEENKFEAHFSGRAIMRAEGIWGAVALVIKCCYIFNLEYNSVTLCFWDLLGRLFFDTPPYRAASNEIKSAFRDITADMRVPRPEQPTDSDD